MDITIRHIAKYFIILIFLLCFNIVDAENRKLFHVSSDNKLVGTTPYSFFEDRDGFIWIGTDIAVNRYDGANMLSFNIPDNKSHNRSSFGITQTIDGKIWIANGIGLLYINKLKTVEIYKNDRFPNCQVNCLIPDSWGNLYVGTQRGLFLITSSGGCNELKHSNMGNAFDGNVTSMTVDGHILYIASASGVYSYDCLHPDRGLDFIIEGNYSAIAVENNQIFLGTSNDGVFTTKLDKIELNHIKTVGNVIKTIQIENNHLFVATDGSGAEVIDTDNYSQIEVFNVNNGLTSNAVYCFMQDSRRNLWFGLFTNGLEYSISNLGIVRAYKFDDIFDTYGRSVSAAYADGHIMLIGMHDGLNIVDERARKIKKISKPVIESNIITWITRYRDNYIVCTYGGGAYQINSENMSIIPLLGKTFSGKHVGCAAVDSNDNLWLVTSDGVWVLNGDTIVQHFNEKNSKISQGYITSITFDSNGFGWIGGENGLAIWDPKRDMIRTDLIEDTPLKSAEIVSISEINNKEMFIVYDKNKIFRCDLGFLNKSEVNYPMNLLTDDIKRVIEDKYGTFWVATSNGLYEWNGKDRYERLGYIDGVVGDVFSPRISVNDNGDYIFANNKGALILNPEFAKNHKSHKLLKFTNLMSDGESCIDRLQKVEDKTYGKSGAD